MPAVAFRLTVPLLKVTPVIKAFVAPVRVIVPELAKTTLAPVTPAVIPLVILIFPSPPIVAAVAVLTALKVPMLKVELEPGNALIVVVEVA